jgi:hypothetical protein
MAGLMELQIAAVGLLASFALVTAQSGDILANSSSWALLLAMVLISAIGALARLISPRAYDAGGLFGSPGRQPMQIVGGVAVAAFALGMWFVPGAVASTARIVPLVAAAACAGLGAWFADDPLIFAAALGALADPAFSQLAGRLGGPWTDVQPGLVMLVLALAVAVAGIVRNRQYMAWANGMPMEFAEQLALERVRSSSVVERHVAANKLGFKFGADSIAPLVAAMSDADESVANTAAFALDLARKGTPDRWWFRALETGGFRPGDEVSDEEFNAAFSLAHRRWLDTTTAIYRELMSDPVITEHVIALVNPESPRKVFAVAAIVLTDGHSAPGIDHVARFLGHPVREVSVAAEFALSAGGLRSFARVTEAIESPHARRRAAAARALIKLVANPVGLERERSRLDRRFGDPNDSLSGDEDAIEIAEYRAVLPAVFARLAADEDDDVRAAITECTELLWPTPVPADGGEDDAAPAPDAVDPDAVEPDPDAVEPDPDAAASAAPAAAPR